MYFKTVFITIVSMFVLSESNSWSQTDSPANKEVPPEITWQKLNTHTDASFRGLCVVSEDVFWISGSKGTILRTIDGGKTFKNVSIPNASDRDFRDVHAFNANTAVVMNAGTPGVFFRTTDGGNNWSLVYNDLREDIFFDAMDFWDDQRGVAFGDPIGGRLVVLLTEDGGKLWNELDRELQPKMFKGEAGFAASGSCLVAEGKETILIGTGGHMEGRSNPASSLLVSHDRGRTWTNKQVPFRRNQSSGIFSLCMTRDKKIIAVGGDYTQPDEASQNCAISWDNGHTWKQISIVPPSGFRSAVAVSEVNDEWLSVTAGTNGIDVSMDQGLSWHRVSDISTNAIAFSPDGNAVVTAGPDGSAYLGILQF